MREIVVTKNEDSQRLDKFLEKYLPKAPKSLLQKFLRQKRIKLNKKKAQANSIIYEGDIINIYIYEEELVKWEKKTIIGTNINLQIAYEDKDIVVIEKPKNILSHPSSNQDIGNTIVDFLLSYLNKKGDYNPEIEKTFTPSIVNRLDRNTEGLIIGVKNRSSQVYMNKIINSDLIEKNYQAIVHGKIEEKMTIRENISKNHDTNKVSIDYRGKDSLTIVEPIKTFDNLTLVKIRILTGRSHQIRIHLSHIGHPIVGDLKYGDKNLDKKYKSHKNSQYLMANELIFSDKIELLQLRSLEIQHSRSHIMERDFYSLMED